MSLCFLGAANENFTLSNTAGRRQVSIQLQRMLTFGDPSARALSTMLTIPKQHMAARMVRDRGQGFCQL